MELTYSEKLQRIRTGVEVVALAQKKLHEEAQQLLHEGERVYLSYFGETRPAILRGFTGDGELILEPETGDHKLYRSLDELVEAPTP